jgi:nitrate/nitrite transporter NarK
MYRFWTPALVGALSLLALPVDAFAYLDPGTGSYVLQMIIAGLLGAAFAVKMSWFRIKRFFLERFSRNDRND